MTPNLYNKTSCKIYCFVVYLSIELTRSDRTNNGLIHVLDKIMSPIAGEQFPTGANSSTNNGGSSTSKPSAANGMNSLLNYQFFIIGFIVAIFL